MSNGRLRLSFGTQHFPLVVVKGEIEPFRQIERRALEVEGARTDESKDFAVAVVLANQVDVFVIEKHRKGRGVKFYTTFGEPVPSEQPVSIGRRQQVRTVLTD